MLNVVDHSRSSAGMKYVYPVVSRRAGGVSVGINLNTNNACNWACIYCQVPGLSRGGPLPVDLVLLESELRNFLLELTTGDYLIKNVPPEARQLVDVAFSGNGEPTSAPEFAEAVRVVESVLHEVGIERLVKLRLITNGSLIHRPGVQQGIARIGALDGEVWFKLDRATESGIERVNGVRISPDKVMFSVLTCAGLAPTWIQTCYFALDGREMAGEDQLAYLRLLDSVRQKIKGVHLYGLARPSLQAEAWRLSGVTQDQFQRFAKRIALLGIEVVANP